jgi:DNA-binding HxlR family transcriptional regulator
MRRKSFRDMRCTVARSLDLLGEWWTFLILRDAFSGIRQFDGFERSLGIAPNILSARLRRLVDAGVLVRVVSPTDGRAREYWLTEKGKALLPVLVALMQWGDRWVAGPANRPLRLVDREHGEEVRPVEVLSARGRPLRFGELRAERLAPPPSSSEPRAHE